MQLTKHFRLEEFTRSNTAARKGINNKPGQAQHSNLIEILAPNMELVRRVLGFPITVTSGYRSPALNDEVGGDENSKHMSGRAADFVCPQFGTPAQIIRELYSSCVPFSNIIEEYGEWVHISFPERVVVRTVRMAKEDASGKVSYPQINLGPLATA